MKKQLLKQDGHSISGPMVTVITTENMKGNEKVTSGNTISYTKNSTCIIFLYLLYCPGDVSCVRVNLNPGYLTVLCNYS